MSTFPSSFLHSDELTWNITAFLYSKYNVFPNLLILIVCFFPDKFKDYYSFMGTEISHFSPAT